MLLLLFEFYNFTGNIICNLDIVSLYTLVAGCYTYSIYSMADQLKRFCSILRTRARLTGYRPHRTNMVPDFILAYG